MKKCRVDEIRPLSELLEEAGLQPLKGVDGLAEALRDENVVNKEKWRSSLICETLVITLFTTRAGISLLPLLSESAKRKKGVSRGQEWQNNEELMLRFFAYVLENRNSGIDSGLFTRARWKLPLFFLIESKFLAASMVLDQNYNLLLDYIHSVIPMVKKWTQRALAQSGFFKDTVVRYGRVFELHNSSQWYDFSAQNSTQELAAVQKFLSENNEQALSILQEMVNEHKESHTVNTTSYHHRISQHENVYSFDLNQDGSLEIPNIMTHASVRHDILLNLLKLPVRDSPLLKLQFKLMAGLVDPLTQPPPNDQHIISLNLIYEMLLGLLEPSIRRSLCSEGCDWRFHLCFNMQKIIQESLKRLNLQDFETLNSINNSDEEGSWRENLHLWLPHGLNTQNLELVYMIDILAVYTIYKLYEHQPIQLNPFLSPLISLWKNLTCVILLGLEIDRFEEEHETFETPVLVRATIRGAAALRAVVATILNGHVETYKHDFMHEPLNTFMSPHGRKLCQGALYADLRSHAAALLALGTELEDVTNLLSDLQAGDRFDEDVRYMFEYECDDYNEDDSSQSIEKDGSPTIEQPKILQRRCNCIFDDDEMVEDEDLDGENDEAFFSKHMMLQQNAQASLAMSSNGKPRAVRSNGAFEFDYSGKDWRDIPRGSNLYYAPDYTFVETPSLSTVIKLTMQSASEKLNEKDSHLLLKSVASCVKNEQDEITLGNLIDPRHDNETEEAAASPDKIEPDDVYEMWCENSTFEKMVYHNHTLAWKLMDEMLLCIGYRRVLIWFITHMELNHSLIHYIFELVMGLRGDSDDNGLNSEGDDQRVSDDKKSRSPLALQFSRQGSLQLSAIETKMLLQEFFTNAAIYISKKSEETSNAPSGEGLDERQASNEIPENVSLYAMGLMKLICFMVKTFIDKGKFDFSESECVFELQALLMNWIGIIPEAKNLFFELKGLIAGLNNGNASQDFKQSNVKDKANKEPAPEQATAATTDGADFEFNRKLVSLLPPLVKNKEENAAMQTLRSFIKTSSFLNVVPTIGRKIIYEDDKILPLPESDLPLALHEYIADYENNYAYGSGEEYEDD